MRALIFGIIVIVATFWAGAYAIHRFPGWCSTPVLATMFPLVIFGGARIEAGGEELKGKKKRLLLSIPPIRLLLFSIRKQPRSYIRTPMTADAGLFIFQRTIGTMRERVSDHLLTP